MQIFKTAVYDQFFCIASACPDSCCHEWSVAIDETTAAAYRSLPGELGQRLRQVLRQEDGDTVMAMENGRCPMWRADGLCRIQAELGHDALCKTCRDFPRLTHDYGDFQEWGLELSCPEAARLILTTPYHSPTIMQMPGGEPAEYDADAMDALLRTREFALALLCSHRPIQEKLALLLMYGYHAQAILDGEPWSHFDADAALETANGFACSGDALAVLDFFSHLEILTDRWRNRLAAPADGAWQPEHLALARYFVERYWLQAVSDYDLVGRVKLAVVSCLVIHILGGDLLQTAQLYSKEIENDPDNVEAILEGAYTAPGLTDRNLLGLLLRKR